MALINKLTNIADAIRNKNGSTDKLTLDSMVTAINDMASVTIDGVKVKEKLDLLKIEENIQLTNIPYNLRSGTVAVLNDGIHVIGGFEYTTSHKVWDGTSWKNATSVPWCCNASSVVLNNEIHIMGANNSNYSSKHYKFNGSSWTQVSTTPHVITYFPGLTILNEEIHLFGSDGEKNDNTKKHYKFNGSSWTQVSTTPFYFQNGTANTLNGKIHIMNGASPHEHYVWDGSSWTFVGTLPFHMHYQHSATIHKGELYCFANDYYCRKWNGSLWEEVGLETPYKPYGAYISSYDGEIHLLSSSNDSSHYNSHYILNHKYYKEA